jgi:hypothetical protein
MITYRGCTWALALHAFLWISAKAQILWVSSHATFSWICSDLREQGPAVAHSQSHCANPVLFQSRSKDTRRSFEDTIPKPTGSRSLRS